MDQEQQAWRLVSRRTLLTDPWLEVYEDRYELPDGSTLDEYHSVRERDGVIIVAFTPQHELLMVRQFRPGIAAITHELPAGFLEDGETDPLERARKELSEETGYVADEWRSLGIVHDAPHRLRKTSHVFLALGVRKTGGQHEDSTEFVEYERLPLEQVRQMLQANEITSAVMIAALFKALMARGINLS